MMKEEGGEWAEVSCLKLDGPGKFVNAISGRVDAEAVGRWERERPGMSLAGTNVVSKETS